MPFSGPIKSIVRDTPTTSSPILQYPVSIKTTYGDLRIHLDKSIEVIELAP